MTGQPFDETFFTRDGFIYDTEPASKAVIVMEQLAPAAAYTYYHDIQSAFYSQNQDITSGEVLAAYAESHGVNRNEFLAALTSEIVHKETWGQFTFSGSLGIRGFPALVIENAGKFMLALRGWQPFDQVRAVLEEATAVVSGESCDVGGEC